MIVYSCDSKVLGKKTFTLNLTSAIVDNLKYSGSNKYLIWNLYVDNGDNIQNMISTETLSNDINVIKSFKVNLSYNNSVKVPLWVSNIFLFSNKDVIKLEHDIVNETSRINIIPFKNNIKYTDVKNKKFIMVKNKLVIKDNIKNIVFPKNLRKEVKLDGDDWFVLSVYKNSFEELYIEIVKLEDLINERVTNNDNLIYRISEQVSYVYSAYYFIPDEYLMNKFNIKTLEYTKWKVLFEKYDIIRLEFE